jgi:hypothetical protein
MTQLDLFAEADRGLAEHMAAWVARDWAIPERGRQRHALARVRRAGHDRVGEVGDGVGRRGRCGDLCPAPGPSRRPRRARRTLGGQIVLWRSPTRRTVNASPRAVSGRGNHQETMTSERSEV